MVELEGPSQQLIKLSDFYDKWKFNQDYAKLALGRQLLQECKEGNVKNVIELIKKNSAPFLVDGLGTSPLHHAAAGNHTKVAEILITFGMNVDTYNKVFRTSLHVACTMGHTDMVKLLLNYSANIDAKDMLLMTPLHWAVESQQSDLVSLLLSNGANTKIKDKFNQTALELAQNRKSELIIELIKGSDRLSFEDKVRMVSERKKSAKKAEDLKSPNLRQGFILPKDEQDNVSASPEFYLQKEKLLKENNFSHSVDIAKAKLKQAERMRLYREKIRANSKRFEEYLEKKKIWNKLRKKISDLPPEEQTLRRKMWAEAKRVKKQKYTERLTVVGIPDTTGENKMMAEPRAPETKLLNKKSEAKTQSPNTTSETERLSCDNKSETTLSHDRIPDTALSHNKISETTSTCDQKSVTAPSPETPSVAEAQLQNKTPELAQPYKKIFEKNDFPEYNDCIKKNEGTTKIRDIKILKTGTSVEPQLKRKFTDEKKTLTESKRETGKLSRPSGKSLFNTNDEKNLPESGMDSRKRKRVEEKGPSKRQKPKIVKSISLNLAEGNVAEIVFDETDAVNLNGGFSLPPQNKEKNKNYKKLLEQLQAQMRELLKPDLGTVVSSAIESGQSIRLTEAGMLALNSYKTDPPIELGQRGRPPKDIRTIFVDKGDKTFKYNEFPEHDDLIQNIKKNTGILDIKIFNIETSEEPNGKKKNLPKSRRKRDLPILLRGRGRSKKEKKIVLEKGDQTFTNILDQFNKTIERNTILNNTAISSPDNSGAKQNSIYEISDAETSEAERNNKPAKSRPISPEKSGAEQNNILNRLPEISDAKTSEAERNNKPAKSLPISPEKSGAEQNNILNRLPEISDAKISEAERNNKPAKSLPISPEKSGAEQNNILNRLPEISDAKTSEAERNNKPAKSLPISPEKSGAEQNNILNRLPEISDAKTSEAERNNKPSKILPISPEKSGAEQNNILNRLPEISDAKTSEAERNNKPAKSLPISPETPGAKQNNILNSLTEISDAKTSEAEINKDLNNKPAISNTETSVSKQTVELSKDNNQKLIKVKADELIKMAAQKKFVIQGRLQNRYPESSNAKRNFQATINRSQPLSLDGRIYYNPVNFFKTVLIKREQCLKNVRALKELLERKEEEVAKLNKILTDHGIPIPKK